MKVVWRNTPLQEIIFRVLIFKNGVSTDKELYDAVTKIIDISYSEFLKTLLKLELYGLIRVTSIKEDMLAIELVKERVDENWELI